MDFGKPEGLLAGFAALLGGMLVVASAFLAIAGLVLLGKGLEEAHSGSQRSVPTGFGAYDDWQGFGIACFLAQANVLTVNFLISWGGLVSWLSLYLVLILAAAMLGAQVLFFKGFREARIHIHYLLFPWAVVIGLLLSLSWLLAQGRLLSFEPLIRVPVYIVNAVGFLLFFEALAVMAADRFLLCALQAASASGLAGFHLLFAGLPAAGLPVRLALSAGILLCFTLLFLTVLLRPYARFLIGENRILVREKGARMLGLQFQAAAFFLVLLGLLLAFLREETDGFSRVDVFFLGGTAGETARSAGRVLAGVLVPATAAEALGNLILAFMNFFSLSRRRRTIRRLAAELGARPRDLVANEDGTIRAAGEYLLERIIRQGNLKAAVHLSEIARDLDPRLSMFIVNALLARGDRSPAAARHYEANVKHFLAGCAEIDPASWPGLVKRITASVFLGGAPLSGIRLARPTVFGVFSTLAACRDLISEEYVSRLSLLFRGTVVCSRQHQYPAAFDGTLSLMRSGRLPGSLAGYRQQCADRQDWSALGEAYLLGPYDLDSCLALLRNRPADPNADFYRLDMYENAFLPWLGVPPVADHVRFVRDLCSGRLPRGAVTISLAPFVIFLKTIGARPMDRDHPLLAPLTGILRRTAPAQIEALCFDTHNTIASAHALMRVLRRIRPHADLVRRLLQGPLTKVSDTSRTEEGCSVAELIFRADCLCMREEQGKENENEKRRA